MTKGYMIKNFIPIQYIKDFGRDCSDEGMIGEEHVNEVCECIIASWLAVKDTDYAKQYLHERKDEENEEENQRDR